MFELLIATLLALGCPVPPNLPTGSGTVVTAQDDTGGDNGHLPPPPPPPISTIGG